MEDYRVKMKAYRAQQLPKQIRTLEVCATPTEETKCEGSLFLRKYILDKDDNPDQTKKTPDSIPLPGYIDRGLALTGEETERVHALHGGLEGASHVTHGHWLEPKKKGSIIRLMSSTRNKLTDVRYYARGMNGISRR